MRHARRRWLAVVRVGSRLSALRRPDALPGAGRRGHDGGLWHRDIPQPEEGNRTQAARHFRTALLGHAATARSILFPLGPHHYSLRGGVIPEPLLSGPGDRKSTL